MTEADTPGYCFGINHQVKSFSILFESIGKKTTCERLSQDRDIVTGAGRSREGGSDIVIELGRLGCGVGPPKSRLAVMIGIGRSKGGVSWLDEEWRDRSET